MKDNVKLLDAGEKTEKKGLVKKHLRGIIEGVAGLALLGIGIGLGATLGSNGSEEIDESEDEEQEEQEEETFEENEE